MNTNTYTTAVYHGDSREILKGFPNGYFNLIVTSPPYADSRKSHYDSITPDQYVDFMLSFHEQFWRVLADDGSFVLNIKDKVVNGVRHRYVWHTIEALSSRGWYCVDDYLWTKPNAMPGYWKNRLRDEWEYCFHMTKGKHFAMYQDAVRKPMGDWAPKRLASLTGKSAERHNSENASGFGRDLRKWLDKETVLPGNTISVPLVGKNMGHPAVFPVGLPEFFIRLFTKQSDHVLDPFAGSGSTALAAEKLCRNVALIDTKAEYIDVIRSRLDKNKAPDYMRQYYEESQPVQAEKQLALLEGKSAYPVDQAKQARTVKAPSS
ncbi:MAG: site-specific DNA-methyltransferase [Chloroflexi bacterium]|nr:site-specific DNA-methyltransferase [Chloroflexota bacterium]MBI3734535.1 site-specific DNA-methyltransferase [Chloroflexota bacterium]